MNSKSRRVLIGFQADEQEAETFRTLSGRLGMSYSDVLRMALAELAQKEGLQRAVTRRVFGVRRS